MTGLRKIFLIAAALMAVAVSAAPKGGGDTRAMAAKATQAARAMRTMQADFVQTKHLKMLGDKMVSYGSMQCRQPSMLRWEYTRPYKCVLTLDGTKVVLERGGRKEVTDTGKNRMFREVVRIMMGTLSGQCLADSKDFKVALADGTDGLVATLTPLRKEMKSLYRSIVLHFNRRTMLVERVVMHEANGDRTEIELRNVRINRG